MALANVERARTVLGHHDIEFVVAATRENTLYLSGLDNHGQLSFPYTEQSYVVGPASAIDRGILVLASYRSESAGAADAALSDVVTFGHFPRALSPDAALIADERRVRERGESASSPADAFEGLATAIELAGATAAVVAVDERGPDRALLECLTARFPRATFLPGAELLREIRSVKTPAELERLRRAIAINEAGFRAVFDAARKGVTEDELKHRFRVSVSEHGGTPGHCLLKFGRRMAMFQDPRGDAILEPGQAIFLDAGATWQGYRSDLGRLVSYGPASERLVTLYAASRAGQDRAFELLTPGAAVADVFRGAVDATRANGNPDFKRTHTGHAVGLEWNDQPMISDATDAVVETGMVLEVELPYYELGFGGAHIEDTVLIGAEGPIRLSSLDRDLVVLDTA